MLIPKLRTISVRSNQLYSLKNKFLNCDSLRFSTHHPGYSFKVQNREDFDERVLKSKLPVIVDFMATWCNPCKLLGPRIERVIDEKQGKVLLAKVDIDENADLALELDVKIVPTMQTFKNGIAGDRLIGLRDEDEIRAYVNSFIGQ